MLLSELCAFISGGQVVRLLYVNGLTGVYDKHYTGAVVETSALDELLENFPALDSGINSVYALGDCFCIDVDKEFPVEYSDYELITDMVVPDVLKNDREITLKDWAKKNGISDATARQKALNGFLKTAHKVGRDWVIRENELNIDNRRK